MSGRSLRAATATATALAIHAGINALVLRRPVLRRPGGRAVSVLVPARNEADRIGPCLRAIMAADWPDLQVLVLDDVSDDGTAAAVRRVAAGDPRVTVLAGVAPPPGWLGKPWACAQLAAAATGDVLVFVDADVEIAPGAIAAVVGLVEDGLDLACPYPRQLADGVTTRLVQPLLQWSWLTFLPLRMAERAGNPALTAANGQFMACTARAYAAAGGHMAVRDQVLEDIALARAFKRAGLSAGVADGTALATCRMYASADDLVDGYTKSLWAAFGSPAGALGVVTFLAWLYLQPPVALARALRRGDGRTTRIAALGVGAGVLGRLVAAWRTGGRLGDAAAHPASVATLCGLIGSSLVLHRRGTLTWRGRPLLTDTGLTSTKER